MASPSPVSLPSDSLLYGKAASTAAPRPIPPHLYRPIDEGYSEDSRSQTGAEDDSVTMADQMDESVAHIASVRQWLLSQPVDLRASFARELIHSLPNAIISDLVREADQRLHFDPVKCFPEEIISNIFSFCDPRTLQAACLVSQAWRLRACNIRLWQRLYGLEGWTHNADFSRQVERAYGGRTGSSNPSNNQQTSPKSAWLTPSAEVEADEEMVDVLDELSAPPRLLKDEADVARHTTWDHFSASLRTDWRYLYHQRRRLERNWQYGRFKNFRLPHINHPDEAHKQCVYTIQYTAKHLVSGSRDKSVRVWNLDTQRLKYPPLQQHDGSVLCLQYDERPQSDIIVSGGSDSDVIVWRFSTGALITRMRKAHSESVLNLRFDDRYLVTCSKDKTIKVWNRRRLTLGDTDYPVYQDSDNVFYPAYVVRPDGLRAEQPIPLPPWSLLMTFSGHNAAVNAIQILDDEIVSASGDRRIILWNIKTGQMIRTFTGHAKGIACVQYDGRRIVSGSSDNTVRIFDSKTAAEVAVLEGHRNLVRTVQADFSDLPGEGETLEAQAREDDRRIRESRARGTDTFTQPYFVMGAKLPTGGGGNRWSKIVSGSYDETVIVWRRDRTGRWFIAKELRQEDAVRAASGIPAIARRTPRPAPLAASDAATPSPSQPQPHQPASTNRRSTALDTTPTSPPPATLHAQLSPTTATSTADPLPTSRRTSVNPPPQNQQQQQQSQQQHVPAHTHASHPHFQLAPPSSHPPYNHAGPNSRVFKLQFDARRIICCSQEPVIVGWDFSNGDEAIADASRFFGEPS